MGKRTLLKTNYTCKSIWIVLGNFQSINGRKWMKDIFFSSWGEQVFDNRGKESQDYQKVMNINLPEYFRQDDKIKALMGWYGIVIRSEDVNIVDLSRSYMEEVHRNSCGKCFPCRLGTKMMADTLNKICNGNGAQEDIKLLQELGQFVSSVSKCNIGQSGPIPILHALNYFADDFTLAVNSRESVQGGNYISRLTAPCMDACPIHLDIPAYIECIKEGNYRESLKIIKDRLPLPGVAGRVCVRPCEDHCRRKNLDEPISIKFLKRFVADQDRSMLVKASQSEINKSPKTGHVAIVGAGPAGITCAYHLALKGHQVTIYEHLGEPGGMSAVGIPDYRLPRNIIQEEVALIQKMGVPIKYTTTIGKDIMLSTLEDEFDAVFIAIGAHDSSPMRVEGEDKGYKGFIPGVQYLRDINEGRDPYPKGKKVAVIGGGNVAIDCVRCSFRVNKEDVNLIYRRTKKEMPADDVEIHDAEEEQVKFHYLTNPVCILAKNGKVIGMECIRMELGEPDSSGRRRPVPIQGSEFVIDCDIVVPAIGQSIDLSILDGVDDIETTRWRTIVVNEFTKQTNRPKIFSAGDCETGPGALITACSGGRKAAFSIDSFINDLPVEMTEEDHFDQLLGAVQVFDPDEDMGLPGGSDRKQLEMIPPDIRKTTFDEVESGFSTPDARSEASRCLRCYCIAMIAI